MEKYVKLELEVIEIKEDIICTSNETSRIPWSNPSGSGQTALKPYEIYEFDEKDEE